VDPQTLEPLSTLDGEALLAIAARLGGVRLIDNLLLTPAGIQTNSPPADRKAMAACNA
jgi:hypothetical protein